MIGNSIFKEVKKYHFNSIVFKNFIKFFCIMAFCLMLVSVLLYNSAVKSKHKEIKASYEAEVRNYAKVSDLLLYDVRSKIFELLTTGNTATFLYSNNPLEDYPNVCNTVLEDAESYVKTNAFLHSVCVYSEKSKQSIDTHYPSKTDYIDDNWMEFYKSMDEPFGIFLRRYSGRYPYVLTLIQKTDVSGPQGAIVVNLDIEKKGQVIGYSEERKDTFVAVAKDGAILNDNHKNYVGHISDYDEIDAFSSSGEKNIVVEKKYAVAKIKSEYFDIDYYGIFDAERYLADILRTKFLLSSVYLLFLIFSLLIGFFASFETYKPIKKIIGMLDLTETETISKNSDELSYVAGRITELLSSNNELRKKVSKQTELNHKLYMSLLSKQIDTHFINNTINIINSQIVLDVGKGHRSSAMLIKLSRLLKNAYNINNVFVDIKDEVEYTKIYIDLLHERYPGIFDCVWDVDEDAQKLSIPKMTLQPLIENAVYHGIVPSEKEGKVEISIKITDDRLQICVKDNGVGINEENLSKINERMNLDIVTEHIGINNIYQRFLLLYQEDFNMTYESKEGEYTLVKIHLPLEHTTKEDENI